MKSVENFIAEFKDKTISVALQDLETGMEFFSHADVMMHPASTMKIPVMMEVFRQAEAGLFTLDDRLEIYNSFTSIADGSKFSLDVSDDSESTLYQR
ncbi:MAG TPA: serine hydrolase, partial [Anaerolineales bacterium]|nr:serine hydrolase [Anaerolineales bacterium]